MPPQIQALLQDKKKLAIVGGGVALVLIILIVVIVMFSGGGNKKENPSEKPLATKEQRTIATLKNTGKAIEIQALMAREGLQVDRESAEGGVEALILEEGATQGDRDRALLALVQSGLMDANIGLEAFDQGDLTASREEKRIKLIRAQQGELARLIRKIDPVMDASVHITIPDPSVFRRDEKPPSASVQVVLPNGERLTRDKVRSIMNLMVASVQGLDSAHVAIADTNGNTYNSVVDGGTELQNRLEERDHYMKQKVTEQLNKLVGPGHFVVTVSTFLREAPMETMVETYEPDQSAVMSKQHFTEQLNASNAGGAAGGPVSTMMPRNLRMSGGNTGNSKRGYVREGLEVQYANAKTQWVETSVPGMMEDISIAVTIDRGFFPGSLTVGELQRLLARAASPKVEPNKVSIAMSDFHRPLPIHGGSRTEAPAATNFDWVPWAAGAVGFIVLLLFVGMVAGGKGKGVDPAAMERTHAELQQLREIAAQQQAQFQAAQQQTRQLIEAQRKQITAQAQQQQTVIQSAQLKEALVELAETVRHQEVDPDELDLPIKSWIES